MNEIISLNFAGLQRYDTLIKSYIAKHSGDKEKLERLETLVNGINDVVKKNVEDITVLNGSVTVTGSVSNMIDNALRNLLNDPEDTLAKLQEVLDWMNEDGFDFTSLVSQVTRNTNDIDGIKRKLKSKVEMGVEEETLTLFDEL